MRRSEWPLLCALVSQDLCAYQPGRMSDLGNSPWRSIRNRVILRRKRRWRFTDLALSSARRYRCYCVRPTGCAAAPISCSPPPNQNPDLPNSNEALRRLIVFRQERNAEQQAQQMELAGNVTTNNGGNAPSMQAPKAVRCRARIYLGEAKAHYDAAINANIGLRERLVWFWSNHFCVSADKGPVRVLCGAYEREAIRPHVLGSSPTCCWRSKPIRRC